VLASGVVDVTCGCQNGATARARWHDAPVVDLERIKAESVAYFRSLDERATLRTTFATSTRRAACGTSRLYPTAVS
jgi:hypothetical protein